MNSKYIQSPGGRLYMYFEEEEEPIATQFQFENVAVSSVNNFQNQGTVEGTEMTQSLPYSYSAATPKPKDQGIVNKPAVMCSQTSSHSGGGPGSASKATVSLTPMGKRKRKNEKERLCHIIPEDLLLQVEDQLLRLVFSCPSIWDHTIDVKDRNPEIKSKKWLHVQTEMTSFVKLLESSIDVAALKLMVLKNTWEKIRENYVRYKNECRTSSGGAAKEVDPPDHVDIMRNYDGMLARRKPVTSLTFENVTDKECYSPKNDKSDKKKKDNIESLTPFLETATMFLEKITQEDKKNPEPTKKMPDVNSTHTLIDESQDRAVLYANSLVSDLRQLDDHHFTMAKMVIAKGIYDCYVKQKETRDSSTQNSSHTNHPVVPKCLQDQNEFNKLFKIS